MNIAYNHGFSAHVLSSLLQIVEARRDEIKGFGMTTSARPLAVRFDRDVMWVELDDGRTLGVPLAWFPRLLHAAPEDRERVELSPSGLHWEALNEDVSVAGLLAGRGDRTGSASQAA